MIASALQSATFSPRQGQWPRRPCEAAAHNQRRAAAVETVRAVRGANARICPERLFVFASVGRSAERRVQAATCWRPSRKNPRKAARRCGREQAKTLARVSVPAGGHGLTPARARRRASSGSSLQMASRAATLARSASIRSTPARKDRPRRYLGLEQELPPRMKNRASQARPSGPHRSGAGHHGPNSDSTASKEAEATAAANWPEPQVTMFRQSLPKAATQPTEALAAPLMPPSNIANAKSKRPDQGRIDRADPTKTPAERQSASRRATEAVRKSIDATSGPSRFSRRHCVSPHTPAPFCGGETATAGPRRRRPNIARVGKRLQCAAIAPPLSWRACSIQSAARHKRRRRMATSLRPFERRWRKPRPAACLPTLAPSSALPAAVASAEVRSICCQQTRDASVAMAMEAYSKLPPPPVLLLLAPPLLERTPRWRESRRSH